LPAVTCRLTELDGMVTALAPDVASTFAHRLTTQLGCAEHRVSAAAKAPASGPAKRQARKGRRRLMRVAGRVAGSRLSATQRQRLHDEAAQTISAIDAFFGI